MPHRRLQVNQDSNIITLNAHELNLSSAKLQSSALKTESRYGKYGVGRGNKVWFPRLILTTCTSSQEATDIAYDQQKNTVTLTFAESVPAKSEAVLDIVFDGTLNDQMAGFYRSSYKDATGETK
jgi:aminopeptidase 2